MYIYILLSLYQNKSSLVFNDKLLNDSKNKNLKLFRKKPLIFYSIDASKKSKYISETVVFSNSKKINIEAKKYDAVILAVKHNFFKKMDIKKILGLCNHNKLFFDLKSIFDKKHSVFRL